MQPNAQGSPFVEKSATPLRRALLVRRTALLGLAASMSVVILELVARQIPSDLAPPAIPLSFPKPPHHFRHLVDSEYPPPKIPGQLRILSIGDSFTWGTSVNFDDPYPERLERYLNHSGTRTTYEVVNLGNERTSSPEQVELLHEVSARIQPDLVILGYCLNDAENWKNPKGVLALRGRLAVGNFREPEGITGFLFRQSTLVRLVSHRIFNTRTYKGQIRYYHELYRDESPGWRRTRKALLDLDGYSRSTGIPVLTVIFPLFSFGWGEAYPFSDIHAAIHGALDAARLPYVDLLPIYQGIDSLRLEAIPYRDPHPSELAHRIAAQTLYRYLADHRLLEPKKDER